MTLLQFPVKQKPRYSDFELDGILDETLREGSERYPFSVSVENKISLISKILDTGIRDIVYGSGPKDPSYLIDVINQLKESNQLPKDTKFLFIMLLNCHEPLLMQFKNFPNELKEYITISLSMISHHSDKKLFEKTTDTLRAWGFNNFRVSLLNNFTISIDEELYERNLKEIDRTLKIGINSIRINDSLGTIYPEAMAILAANLRFDYPKIDFCLHAHNDRGLGLQNALTSIYYGFNLIEGVFLGTGNRSGLPAIELLNLIFKEKNITVKGKIFDNNSILESARLVEKTFLTIPNIYQPVSGLMVKQENMGVTNIPSFLGINNDISCFLNSTGLHDDTIRKILIDEGYVIDADNISTIKIVKEKLDIILNDIYCQKNKEFSDISNNIINFYNSDIVYVSNLKKKIKEISNLI